MESCKLRWRFGEEPDEAGDIEFLNSDKIIFPGKEISPFPGAEASKDRTQQ